MKQINPNIYPKGGYYFVDSDGSRHVAADGWHGVIARVKAYRKRKGVAEGDVATEVIAQACQRYPMLCHEDDGRRQEQLKRSSLKTKILSWLAWLRGYQDKHFVEDSLARERANICQSCPNNTPLQDGCASCRATVTALRKEILGPHRFVDGRLNACLVMGEDLPTVVHLEMTAVDKGELPAHCWRKIRPL